MKSLLSVMRTLAGLVIGGVSLLVLLLVFRVPLFLLILFMAGSLIVWAVLRSGSERVSTPDGVEISRSDRKYIKQNLRDARRKLKQIRYFQFRLRSFVMWQKISHLYKLARQIIQIVEQQPHKFHQARSFFSAYLDSTLHVLDKYTFLMSQPIRNAEMKETLHKTEQMLGDITAALEQELMQVLSDDVMNLDIELETLRKSIGTARGTEVDMPYTSVSGQDKVYTHEESKR
ncbi:5-bromo-4-chloroindolyl phosphate hydrolysis protein [Aneurinibacillus soli]|uniref:5-bromo-4-chloroindolyl phosphate hydrolysis protein n=1 Tax=Aneurinibacillus soli TaxID=1500254 RepID=A0A0U4NBH3_9BACL|nr:5-bromo-4-chloroindolyl phosphate hydrolysis family protein [Aneurinibacillus soli]PYE60139.1 5-bromo-4-chloroindolyl phosphate hydrolysis protein [Aneurinibacillus soli]BAU26372.1 5-bromo-4-chloroindolyl phosphate hydrolysis protein [Aneurinibacillus soli]